jgi:hypothetical protein
VDETLKIQLHDVISGKSQVRIGSVIQAIASYLEKCAETGREIKDGKLLKKQEEKRLGITLTNSSFGNQILISVNTLVKAQNKEYI